ncbi:hypothetical protein P171DRAFT_460088 [Karstenula rhodostoma CBS 690.94]|uniref:Uncharacterized protein n=1 Tax=Karstenula rhodostoma CBS 690.94 TaxID=1392251 RepID=A0A9P4PS95_9PLEO|nr:hypothetical protein P171DRAFT_460088 [Karstenula rhodostoma CBS 690.94]
MGLYQRRRPSPIQIWPTRLRRQDGVESPESPDSSGISSPESSGLPSPESSGIPSPESPKSPQSTSPTTLSVSSTLLAPPTQTAAPSQITSQAAKTEAAQSTIDSSSRPPPSLPSSSTAQEQLQASPSSSSAQEQPQTSATAAPTSTSAQSSTTEESTSTTDESISPSGTVSDFGSSTTGSTFVPAESELDGERSGIGRHRTEHHDGPILSKGAEAAAITLSVMGFIALIVGFAFFLKHRRRRRNESSMRHAEDAFNPNNNGSLHAPETAHINYDGPPSLARMTRSSTSSNELFAGAHYERPETVSTRSNNSRVRAAPQIAPPQPTPNPFANPPRNKAYDQLRGRPRSTTLTDRGSWVENPFKDPASERFDPFGELQEKARTERRKYFEEARREAEVRRRKEDEQEYLEKDRAGLKVPTRDERKGSDATVGGMGVLDRSGDGRWS